MSVQRYDSGDLRVDGKKRSQQGFLVCEAAIARTGVQLYERADGGIRREYRPPEEVFKADALASAAKAPVTFTPDTPDMHPPELITAENARQFTVGMTHDVKQDGHLLMATVTVMDAKAITAAERGQAAGISCGYHADLDFTPGVTPEGEKYDAIQRNIRINHVAMVRGDIARGGRETRLRLDAHDNAVAQAAATTQEEKKKMKTIKVDGYDFEADEKLAQAIQKEQANFIAARDTEKANHDKARKDAETQKARADVAEEKLAKAEKAHKDATSEERIAALVAERVTLQEKAREVLGDEFKADGKSPAEIKRAVLAELSPGVKLDGKSEDYVNAAFEFALGRAETRSPGEKVRRAADEDHGSGSHSDAEEFDEQKARENMKLAHRDAWKPKAERAAADDAE